MAVTVANNMTLVNDGDTDPPSGWTGSATLSSYSGFQREGAACIGVGGSSSDEDMYYTITSADLSAHTIFGWMNNGVPNSTANIGFGILVGDGTNDRVYAVGGNDNYGHFVRGWAGFRLDTTVLPATTRNITGAGAPTFTTVTRVGYGMNYAINAFGKIDNMFGDILRYIANGSAALTVTGGTTGDRGTWAEIATDDDSTAADKAHGVIRVLTDGSSAYELTYGIEFGAASGDTYFDDSNFQIVIAGTNMAAGNMDVDLIAGTGTNLFALQDGVIAGVSTVSNWDMSAAFETLQFNRMSVSDLGTIAFPSSGGTLREVKDCTFNNCGMINIGTSLTFTGHSFNGASDANGALQFDNALDDANVSDLTFTSDGTGHAIYITAAGSYDFTNFNFSGYSGTNGTTDSVVYNNSGGAVTITVTGGSGTVSYRNGASATTSVVTGARTVKGIAIDSTGSAITGTRAFLRTAATASGGLPYDATVTITRSGTTATVSHTAHGLATNDQIMLRGITDKTEDNIVHTVTVTGTDAYTYTTTDSGSTSYTGTIKCSFVFFYGLANTGTGSNEISVTRTIPADQLVTGWVRKSSGSPYYKEGVLAGTVSSTGNTTFSGVMVSDE